MKRRAVIILALFIPLLLLSCSTASLFKPTPTLTPLPSPTQIVTSTPSSTPTPRPTTPPVATSDLISQYMEGLPEEPEGFEWKILPEQQMAVLIPDLWYFKQEEYPDLLLDAVYVTQEDIDTMGRYSTGMAVFVYEDFEDNEDAEQFALRLLV